MNKNILNAIVVLMIFTITVGARSADDKEKGMIRRIHQSICVLRDFEEAGRAVPAKILANSRGVAILDSDKAGFIVSGTGGSGLLVLRTPKGWSAPSALSTGAMGFGLQFGAKSEKLVLILLNDEAVEAFTQDDKFALGSDITIAVGPEHESAEYLTTSPADVYVYRLSDGFFGGAAVSANFISADKDINFLFYGRRLSPEEITSENFPRPEEAQALYDALNKVPSSAKRNVAMVPEGRRRINVITPPRRMYDPADTVSRNAYNARPDTIELPKPATGGWGDGGVAMKKVDPCDVYPTGNNYVMDNDRQQIKAHGDWPHPKLSCEEASQDGYWYDEQNNRWHKWPHYQSPCDEKNPPVPPMTQWPHLDEPISGSSGNIYYNEPVGTSATPKSRYYDTRPGNYWEPAVNVTTGAVH